MTGSVELLFITVLKLYVSTFGRIHPIHVTWKENPITRLCEALSCCLTKTNIFLSEQLCCTELIVELIINTILVWLPGSQNNRSSHQSPHESSLVSNRRVPKLLFQPMHVHVLVATHLDQQGLHLLNCHVFHQQPKKLI